MDTNADCQVVVEKENLKNLAEYTLSQCPVTLAAELIGGKWKPVVIYNIWQGINRFGGMQRAMPGISKKVLTQELRDLEANGILNRVIFAEIPPRVEYSLTDRGRAALPILEAMAQWGQAHGRQAKR